MEPYEMTLERILPEVSFGYGTIRVYRAPKLQALQTGYSDSPAGGPVGETVGGWRREWVVIGNEDCCGDPILIDSSAEGFRSTPLFTVRALGRLTKSLFHWRHSAGASPPSPALQLAEKIPLLSKTTHCHNPIES